MASSGEEERLLCRCQNHGSDTGLEALHSGLPHALEQSVVCLAFKDAQATIAASCCKTLQGTPCDFQSVLLPIAYQ